MGESKSKKRMWNDMKLIPETGNIQVETDGGNIQVETHGDGNSKDCMCMGNETCGVVRTREAMQKGEKVWVGSCE